jgi:hypothetical protein
MAKIWANRLIAGTKTWDEVPTNRKTAVLAELKGRVENGEITADLYAEITGEVYA